MTVCGLALGAVEAGTPLVGRRMDSEGLAVVGVAGGVLRSGHGDSTRDR